MADVLYSGTVLYPWINMIVCMIDIFITYSYPNPTYTSCYMHAILVLSGRILNKFSSDQGQVDELLPITFFDFIQSLFLCFGAVLLACIAVPWLILVLY